MKKVLFFIYSLGGGGAEKELVDIVNNLDDSEYEITVQTFRDENVYINKLSNKIKYKSIIKVKNGTLRKILGRILTKFINPKVIYKIFIKGDYDYEVAFVEGITTKIISNSNNNNSKKVAWVHCDMSEFKYSLGDYKSSNDQYQSYKKFDQIVVVSEMAKEGFIKEVGDNFNLKVIHNWLDTSKIKEMSLEPVDSYPNNNLINIVTVGRLDKKKGFDLLLRAFKRLIDEGLNLNLKIIGEGRERESLEEIIKKGKIEDHVELLGFQNNPYKYVRKSDIFVCSSLTEGYSLAVAEAITLGKPIVSTKCAGPLELLDNGKYGLLVDINEEDIYEGLKKMVTDTKVRKYFEDMSFKRSKMFEMDKHLNEIKNLFVTEN
jgi:glycosyltransferase involved in cell wall biosynthesis